MKDQKSKEMNTKERIKEILMPEQPLHKLWDVCKCDECRVYREILTVFDEAITSTRTSFRKLVQGWVEYYDTTASGYGVLDRVIIKAALRNILASLDGEEIKQDG